MLANQPPPGDADLDRIVAAFDALMHRIMASHAPELNAFEITMSQTKAMYLVIATGPLRMSELAHRLGVTNSTATGQVDRLVELGLLARHEDPADRRQVVVTATPAGEAALERFRELNSRRMREMLGHVDPADLPIVERAVTLLDAAITAEAAASEGTQVTTHTAITQGDRS